MLMPSPPATQYSVSATIRFLQLKDQNAAAPWTWNQTSTRPVITLSLLYRDTLDCDVRLCMQITVANRASGVCKSSVISGRLHRYAAPRGSVNVMTVPSPTRLSAETCPPCASTKFRAMVSPRPDPCDAGPL